LRFFLSRGNSRKEAGLTEGGGLSLVVTPLAVMDFEEGSKRMRLKSIHPGIPLDEVLRNTGFDLALPDNILETPPPEEEELRVLREEVDPYGVLRGES